ncbi:hypothetical protein LSH36_1157g01008 [Paralvinella palmiformis]|uniref:G-protein coupled receptors family 1 profile domain-containing protein n=1 Tax=Paralvinella palmiformis TaxID=53620 RepID=A0AAD9IV42_9ANNE|nr:hypothetical protein LSH36_1157g01008 [Paralvinella palmiformis]
MIALIIIGLIWLVPIGLQIPWALYYKLDEFSMYINGNQPAKVLACYLEFTDVRFERGFFLGVVFLTYYLVPLVVITVFYTLIGMKVWKRNVAGIRGSKAERNIQRSKVKIVRMLVTVAIVFALLWLPLFSLRMCVYFGKPFTTPQREVVSHIVMPIAQWLGSANSCVNPFIYCFFSEQFRKGIIEILKCASSCCSGRPLGRTNQRHQSVTTTNTVL